MIPYLAPGVLILLALAALLALVVSRFLRVSSGLPGGAVVYSDAGGEGGEALYSPRYGLSGKPDYVVRLGGGRVVPVEVKSGRAPGGGLPRRSHRLQLACYCLLLEESGRRVPYGVVKYRDREIEVPYTPALRSELLEVLALMREGGGARRDHREPRRCAACSYAAVCDQRLE